MKTLFLALLTGAALVTPIYADPIEVLAAQIKADYAYVYAHPNPGPVSVAEAKSLQHDVDQLKEMHADPIEILAAQIRADYAYDYSISTSIPPAEAERLQHNVEQLKEMAYRRAKVNADYAKQRKVAQELAIAEAKKWDVQPQRIANKVTPNGPEYNNENPLYAAHRPTASEWLAQYFKQQEEKEQEFEADQLEEEKHRLEMDKHHTPEHY